MEPSTQHSTDAHNNSKNNGTTVIYYWHGTKTLPTKRRYVCVCFEDFKMLAKKHFIMQKCAVTYV
jgi:hypothetical protein